MTADTTGEGESPGGTLRRFSDVQVYVHQVVTAAILWLLLTGLGITFHDYVPWIGAVLGYGNLVLVHVIGGLVMMVGGLYYAIYSVTGLATGDFPTAWLPGRRDVAEAIQYVKYALGRATRPDAGKYSWLQKAEMYIVIAEVTVLAVTGLLLWYPGLFVNAGPAFLVVADLHAVVAFTLLIGVTYHLFDTHVATFPLDRSIFTGTIDADEASEEYAEWVAETSTRRADGGTATVSRPGPLGFTVAGIVVLLVFGVVHVSILLGAVLSPLPTGEYVLEQFEPGGLLDGPLGAVLAVGLNGVALVLLVSLVALGYGMWIRYSNGGEA